MSNQRLEVQPLTNNRITGEERSPRDPDVVRKGGGRKKRLSLAEVGREEEETQPERVLLQCRGVGTEKEGKKEGKTD